MILLHGIVSFINQAVFHGYVVEVKHEMFEGAADVILTRLANAAEAVGKALGHALEELAAKVCSTPSVTSPRAYV